MDELTNRVYEIVVKDMFRLGVPPTIDNLVGQLVKYEETIYEEVQSQQHAKDLYAYQYLMAIRLELARLQSLLPKD